MVQQSQGAKRRGEVRKAKFDGPVAQRGISTGSSEAIESMPSLLRNDSAPGKILRPKVDPLKVERPLFACSVQAGFPSPADDYLETLLDLNEHMVSKPSATFFVRVKGESMIGAGILSGDILVVDRSLTPRDGSVVIAIVDDELTVKRLWQKNGVCELHSENARFPPIKFVDGMELVIWGVVSGVTRKL